MDPETGKFEVCKTKIIPNRFSDQSQFKSILSSEFLVHLLKAYLNMKTVSHCIIFEESRCSYSFVT